MGDGRRFLFANEFGRVGSNDIKGNMLNYVVVVGTAVGENLGGSEVNGEWWMVDGELIMGVEPQITRMMRILRIR